MDIIVSRCNARANGLVYYLKASFYNVSLQLLRA
jgi:hypothetical protein